MPDEAAWHVPGWFRLSLDTTSHRTLIQCTFAQWAGRGPPASRTGRCEGSRSILEIAPSKKAVASWDNRPPASQFEIGYFGRQPSGPPTRHRDPGPTR